MRNALIFLAVGVGTFFMLEYANKKPPLETIETEAPPASSPAFVTGIGGPPPPHAVGLGLPPRSQMVHSEYLPESGPIGTLHLY